MRALVLSGGGAKGAFQAGAIKHILGDLQIHYDLICGVSVGSLNGSFLSMYKKGEEKQSSDDLLKLWSHINDDAVFHNWYHGLLWKIPAVWKSSIYCTEPLHSLIEKNLDTEKLKSSGKKLRVGAVNIQTEEYKLWSEQDDNIIKAVKASSAFPVFFEPIEIDGSLWVDGGIREITPLGAAFDLGATEIDVIVCSPETSLNEHDRDPNSFTIMENSLNTILDEIAIWDLKVADLYNQCDVPGKRKVYPKILRPAEPVLESSLNFDQKLIQRNIEIGYNAAKKISWT